MTMNDKTPSDDLIRRAVREYLGREPASRAEELRVEERIRRAAEESNAQDRARQPGA
jgi:hypothetical protein